MQDNRELSALLQLIDDPDNEVFDTISAKILHYGKAVIPRLEQLWEFTTDIEVQERIESLIHRVHFQDLQSEFVEWVNAPKPDLLKGAILIAKYKYPELKVPLILQQFDQLRRNIWLELNNYLTPLEQINVFSSILYNYYKLQGHELTERNPDHFFINKVLDSRQGNSFSLGIIYLALADLLDIPVFAVNLPRQFIFAYIDTLHHFFSNDDEGLKQIQFYIDPLNGIVYTQHDVDAYLRKIQAEERELYFTVLTAPVIIHKTLEELALCYQYKQQELQAAEIRQLMAIIKP
jgi:regulator of sirC expression with transglutaminase-like and TPR domain